MVCMISRIWSPSPNASLGKKQLHETWVSPFQQRTNASISAVAGQDDDVSLLFLPADTCQSQSAILKQYLLLIIQLPVNHLRLCFSWERVPGSGPCSPPVYWPQNPSNKHQQPPRSWAAVPYLLVIVGSVHCVLLHLDKFIWLVTPFSKANGKH